jgi:hypothetical protein
LSPPSLRRLSTAAVVTGCGLYIRVSDSKLVDSAVNGPIGAIPAAVPAQKISAAKTGEKTGKKAGKKAGEKMGDEMGDERGDKMGGGTDADENDPTASEDKSTEWQIIGGQDKLRDRSKDKHIPAEHARPKVHAASASAASSPA